MELLVLCVDGLGYDLMHEFNLFMPNESKLIIPKKLYFGGSPSTPNIWGSMFTGKITIHPGVYGENNVFKKLRLTFRDWLKQHGLSWSREGLNFSKSGEHDKDFEPSYKHWKKIIDNSIFNSYDCFLFNIPSICDTFFYGGLEADKEFYNVFKVLAMELWRYNYHIGAIYTHYIDLKAHYTSNPNDLKYLYNEINSLADYNIKKGLDVIVVSDHSCLGKHGDYAYLGTSFPHSADSVLDVYNVIKHRMNQILDNKINSS